MTLIMYDADDNSQFPPGGDAYAAYIDGHIASQPNYDWVVAHFPQAHHLSISVLDNDADVLDIETGAATPADAAGWYQRQKTRGITRPVFYASASLMESALIPAITAARIPRSGYRLWSAHYGAGRHICGPASCGLLSLPADGTQWADSTGHLNADQSVLLADFFGTSPSVPVLTPAEMEMIMNSLPVLQQGAADKPGSVYFVSRMQALTAAVGRVNGLKAAQIAVDGSFGVTTATALKAVQKFFSLQQDAVCGPLTWQALITGSAA